MTESSDVKRKNGITRRDHHFFFTLLMRKQRCLVKRRGNVASFPDHIAGSHILGQFFSILIGFPFSLM
ncbi:unnamed protein product [Phytomonas sp. Hart1]|nr:unnamed protein product [Phytomonas sp. Hart1]|eukprot:CCW67219.1 unnamed protein product [Phytomonas sp. isolate Hart1]